MIEEKRKELFQMYQQWEAEFRETCPHLRNEEYSYPYYLHIPDNWFDSKYRILIVGEEGFGKKQYDLPIEEVQQWSKKYLSSQWDKNDRDYNRYSAFWRRIRKIKEMLSHINPYGYSITWTNLDKIHRNGRGNCKLNRTDRNLLHRIPTKIFLEETRILNPTHIIYFGWYHDSLDAEMQDELRPVLDALYPNEKPGWEPKKIKVILGNPSTGTYHVFTYHPGWGQRQKGYENLVLEEIEKTMQ